jgi:hypothetical protein
MARSMSLRQFAYADIIARLDSGMGTVNAYQSDAFIQFVIATLTGLAVMYLQKRIGGSVGGVIPGGIGFLIGWIVTPAISDDIRRLQRWLVRCHASRESQAK